MIPFSIIPADDPRQAHRLKRYLMAVGTSLLVLVLIIALHQLEHLETAGLVATATGMVFFFAFFFALLRTGVNRGMRDPSLTSAQIACAILVLTIAMYFTSSAARGIFLPIILVAFVFGIFRLPSRELLALSFLQSVSYAAIVLALTRYRPASVDMEIELLRWTVISIVLVWFSLMGGYVSSLRRRLARSHAELETALERSQLLSTRDELTGVHNRRALADLLKQETNRSDRTGTPLSICLLDLDHFKKINDSRGHLAGDRVLQGIVQVIRKHIRTSDHLGRFGGEEFLLILPQTSLEGARTRAERLRDEVEKSNFPNPLADIQLTVSTGVAQYFYGEVTDEWLKRADDALYDAKRGGRNRVALAAPVKVA